MNHPLDNTVYQLSIPPSVEMNLSKSDLQALYDLVKGRPGFEHIQTVLLHLILYWKP